MIQVENHPNLMKNNNGLIVDVDKSSYARYMKDKNNTSKVVELENDINTIKQDMSDIKLLLQQLLKES